MLPLGVGVAEGEIGLVDGRVHVGLAAGSDGIDLSQDFRLVGAEVQRRDPAAPLLEGDDADLRRAESISTTRRVPSFAKAMLLPSIEPEQSNTNAMASVGRGLFFFASDQTGRMSSRGVPR